MEKETENEMFKRVLKVVAGGVDLKEIALSLAVTSPALFLALVEKKDGVEVFRVNERDLRFAAHWVHAERASACRSIADHLRAGNWVAAIKELRAAYNLSLLEASDNVDAVRMTVADWPERYEALPSPPDDRIPFPTFDDDIVGGILNYLIIKE